MMTGVVPLKPVCIKYSPGTTVAGGARFEVIQSLKELARFWDCSHHQFAYIARGRRWGRRQLFMNPGEWLFAHSIPALVQAVTRWDQMGIHVDWLPRGRDDTNFGAEHRAQIEFLKRLDFERAEQGFDDESTQAPSGFWQLNLPPSLRSFPWYSEQSSRIHYPGLTAEQATEIFQLRTYEDWRQSNMREVDFMCAEDLDDLISCCQSAAQPIDV